MLAALLAIHELCEAGESAWGLSEFEAVCFDVLEILPVRSEASSSTVGFVLDDSGHPVQNGSGISDEELGELSYKNIIVEQNQS